MLGAVHLGLACPGLKAGVGACTGLRKAALFGLIAVEMVNQLHVASPLHSWKLNVLKWVL